MVGWVDLSTRKSYESSMKGFHAHYTEIPVGTASQITSASITESDWPKMSGLNFFCLCQKRNERKEGGGRMEAKGRMRLKVIFCHVFIKQGKPTCSCNPETR